jgi:methylglutaconyl-CoA hydratase
MSEVLISKENFYYNVRLNRPEKHNAFNQNMIAKLTSFFREANNDKFAGAVVLTGAGASFCAGGDIEWMQSMAGYSLKENQADAKLLFEMFEAASDCTLPILGHVQGNVFGGGVGLAAICDIAIAESSTKFCFSEVKIGLVPAVISSFVMKKMNINKARELMLTGRSFSADVAFESGLIEFVGRELESKEYLQSTLANIGKNGPEATRETKKLLEMQRFADKAAIKNESIRVIAERRVSAEGQEGLKSFLEKRTPAWIWGTKK